MSPLIILVYVNALPYIIKVLTMPLSTPSSYQTAIEPALIDTPSKNQHSSIEASRIG